ATRLPASAPVMYGPDGGPNGVSIVTSRRSINSAMSYRPLPPMMPICVSIVSKRESEGLPRCLFQLDQDAMRRGGVNKRDERSMRAGTRRLVDQPDTARLECGERGLNVVDAQRDVMQSRPALLDELRDRRIRRRRFEQFQRRAASLNEMRPHALGRHLFRRLNLEPQRIAIERQRLVEIRHRDADVIQCRFHLSLPG